MPAKPLNQLSGMPQMSAAFAGWFTKITIKQITETIVDGFVQTAATLVTFQGTIQPLAPNELKLKPEGQRHWEWLQIHCLTGTLNLLPGNKIIYADKQFKVMGVKDYRLNNYIEYHVVEDYVGPDNG